MTKKQFVQRLVFSGTGKGIEIEQLILDSKMAAQKIESIEPEFFDKEPVCAACMMRAHDGF